MQNNCSGNTMLYAPGQVTFYYQGQTLSLSSGVSYPIQEQREYLQAVGYSAGGQMYVSTKGVSRATFNLTFHKLLAADYEALEQWFNDVCRGTLNPFRFLDGQGKSLTVHLMSNPLSLKEEEEGLYAGQLFLQEELP